MPVGECPGVVVTAERRIVAKSDGGGRQRRQPRHMAWCFLFSVFFSSPSPANTFMLPLEVVDPGGSLSMSLVATAQWRDASRRVSWQAAW
jgi:hypothetical protein